MVFRRCRRCGCRLRCSSSSLFVIIAVVIVVVFASITHRCLSSSSCVFIIVCRYLSTYHSASLSPSLFAVVAFLVWMASGNAGSPGNHEALRQTVCARQHFHMGGTAGTSHSHSLSCYGSRAKHGLAEGVGRARCSRMNYLFCVFLGQFQFPELNQCGNRALTLCERRRLARALCNMCHVALVASGQWRPRTAPLVPLG